MASASLRRKRGGRSETGQKKAVGMNGDRTIQGPVIGPNIIQYGERTVSCWVMAMQDARPPVPLDLSSYKGQPVAVSGRLHGDLWEAQLVRVIEGEGSQEIAGRVMGSNVIAGPDGPVHGCRHGMQAARFVPLDVSAYIDRDMTVTGNLHGHDLYRARLGGQQGRWAPWTGKKSMSGPEEQD